MGDVDPCVILTALGFSTIDEAEPITGGRDTAIFRIVIGDNTSALRVFRPDQLKVSQNEVRAMRLAKVAGIPVPTVHAHGVWHDYPVLLLSWCPGQPLISELTERPERAKPLGMEAGKTLAAINEITFPPKRRDQSWLTWALPNDDPLRQRIAAVARTDRLLHLDFHPLNVLTDGKSITAVLDWANARAGDPRADLARAISILRLDADDIPPHHQSVIGEFERGFVSGYESVVGKQENIPLFHAYAGRLMLRDLADRLHEHPGQRERIEAWVKDWSREAATDTDRS